MNTEMEEVLTILRNPDKIEELILKTKKFGTNSLQFQNLKHCIDSFHLNKTPKGIYQTNILQTAFKFCDMRECFNSFRLVCKTWQKAVETIRVDRIPPPSCLLEELSHNEKNGNFPTFYAKYLKVFRKLNLYFPPNFDMTKWNSSANLLSNNLKKLTWFGIIGSVTPPNLIPFLFKVFKNSESTLEDVFINTRDIIYLPNISLPNLKTIHFWIYPSHNNQLDSFYYFMKSFVDSQSLTKNLQTLLLKNLNDAPKILEYVIKNYSDHFILAPYISILDHLPLKISFLKLENLAPYKFISQVEYLILLVQDYSKPFTGGWNNYQEILSFCPNLKGIIFYKTHNNITSPNTSPMNQNIWQQRSDYFESQNIEIISTFGNYQTILSELRKSKKSWCFDFRF